MNLESEVSEELWRAVERNYTADNWSNAILDAIYCLTDTIRTKTGLQSDGVALVGQAFGGNSPKLRLNRLQTETEKSIQSGMEQMLRGIFQALRNPRSHDRLPDTQADANSVILFVDLLLRQIGVAKTEFVLDTCVDRILEKNFVPNSQYANLIVQEIPERQRLDVALTVYQRKSLGDGSKLRYFFDAITPWLSYDEDVELLRAISDELRETEDTIVLRVVLQILDPDRWLRIDEIARLRTEHWLIRDMQDGRLGANGKCSGGSLATWCAGFLSNFSLKSEVVSCLNRLLSSYNSEAQDYVFRFFFNHLGKLCHEPPKSLESCLLRNLTKGDVRFYNALKSVNFVYDQTPILWQNEEWNRKVRKALDEFKEAAPAAIGEGDLPF